MSEAFSLSASLPPSYCPIPIAPALSHAAAFSQAAAKKRGEPEPTRRARTKQKRSFEVCWGYLFPFSSMFTSSLHLCSGSLSKGSADTFASWPYNTKSEKSKMIKWSNHSMMPSSWSTGVSIHKAGGRRSPFPSIPSWAQQAGLFLRTAPDLKNWKRSDPSNNHAVHTHNA